MADAHVPTTPRVLGTETEFGIASRDAAASDPVANSPREFAAFIKSENEKWGRVIRQAKIQTE